MKKQSLFRRTIGSALNALVALIPGTVGAGKPKPVQFAVGAGFYAMRQNISRAGVKYFRLVVGDKSSLLNAIAIKAQKLVPSRGSRNDRPSTRRARSSLAAARIAGA